MSSESEKSASEPENTSENEASDNESTDDENVEEESDNDAGTNDDNDNEGEESDNDADTNENKSKSNEPHVTEPESTVTWEELGLVDTLCKACTELKWKTPSKIQRESIPIALKGNDIIGLAETGSGKTGAFALPILQALLENPQRYFALILTPTRELAFQIGEQFEALGNLTFFFI